MGLRAVGADGVSIGASRRHVANLEALVALSRGFLVQRTSDVIRVAEYPSALNLFRKVVVEQVKHDEPRCLTSGLRITNPSNAVNHSRLPPILIGEFRREDPAFDPYGGWHRVKDHWVLWWLSDEVWVSE